MAGLRVGDRGPAVVAPVTAGGRGKVDAARHGTGVRIAELRTAGALVLGHGADCAHTGADDHAPAVTAGEVADLAGAGGDPPTTDELLHLG